MDASDVALLERWAHQRDAEAFAELAARHSSMVYAACLRLLRNEADARDISQECFIELLQDMPGRRQERSSLAGWLHTVATRRAINRLKTERRRQAREARFASRTDSDAHPDVEEAQAFVDGAISALPAHLREPVVAHFLEGRTHQAIADALGIPRRTVTSRIAKGIEEIRRSVQKRGAAISVSALASILTVESAQAAPLDLIATLGKLALAKGGSFGPVRASLFSCEDL
jgi:RNA polymerase sigma factor (sigma-70 family)